MISVFWYDDLKDFQFRIKLVDDCLEFEQKIRERCYVMRMQQLDVNYKKQMREAEIAGDDAKEKEQRITNINDKYYQDKSIDFELKTVEYEFMLQHFVTIYENNGWMYSEWQAMFDDTILSLRINRKISLSFDDGDIFQNDDDILRVIKEDEADENTRQIELPQDYNALNVGKIRTDQYNSGKAHGTDQHNVGKVRAIANTHLAPYNASHNAHLTPRNAHLTPITTRSLLFDYKKRPHPHPKNPHPNKVRATTVPFDSFRASRASLRASKILTENVVNRGNERRNTSNVRNLGGIDRSIFSGSSCNSLSNSEWNKLAIDIKESNDPFWASRQAYQREVLQNMANQYGRGSMRNVRDYDFDYEKSDLKIFKRFKDDGAERAPDLDVFSRIKDVVAVRVREEDLDRIKDVVAEKAREEFLDLNEVIDDEVLNEVIDDEVLNEVIDDEVLNEVYKDEDVRVKKSEEDDEYHTEFEEDYGSDLEPRLDEFAKDDIITNAFSVIGFDSETETETEEHYIDGDEHGLKFEEVLENARIVVNDGDYDPNDGKEQGIKDGEDDSLELQQLDGIEKDDDIEAELENEEKLVNLDEFANELDSAINNVLEIAQIEREKILTNAEATYKEFIGEYIIADVFRVLSIDCEIETETDEQYIDVDPDEYRVEVEEALDNVRAVVKVDQQRLYDTLCDITYHFYSTEPDAKQISQIFGRIKEEFAEETHQEFIDLNEVIDDEEDEDYDLNKDDADYSQDSETDDQEQDKEEEEDDDEEDLILFDNGNESKPDPRIIRKPPDLEDLILFDNGNESKPDPRIIRKPPDPPDERTLFEFRKPYKCENMDLHEVKTVLNEKNGEICDILLLVHFAFILDPYQGIIVSSPYSDIVIPPIVIELYAFFKSGIFGKRIEYCWHSSLRYNREYDVLRTRIRTMGMIEIKYELSDVFFNIYDVGGQRKERQKWIHSFERITALIFVAVLNHYNRLIIRHLGSLFNKVMQTLIIVHQEYCKNLCVDNLRCSRSVGTSLRVLQHIHDVCDDIEQIGEESEEKNESELTRSEIIHALEKYHGIINLFFQELSSYMKKKEEGCRVIGNFRVRFDFLRFILEFSSLRLSVKQLDDLWDIVIGYTLNYQYICVGIETDAFGVCVINSVYIGYNLFVFKCIDGEKDKERTIIKYNEVDEDGDGVHDDVARPYQCGANIQFVNIDIDRLSFLKKTSNSIQKRRGIGRENIDIIGQISSYLPPLYDICSVNCAPLCIVDTDDKILLISLEHKRLQDENHYIFRCILSLNSCQFVGFKRIDNILCDLQEFNALITCNDIEAKHDAKPVLEGLQITMVLLCRMSKIEDDDIVLNTIDGQSSSLSSEIEQEKQTKSVFEQNIFDLNDLQNKMRSMTENEKRLKEELELYKTMSNKHEVTLNKISTLGEMLLDHLLRIMLIHEAEGIMLYERQSLFLNERIFEVWIAQLENNIELMMLKIKLSMVTVLTLSTLTQTLPIQIIYNEKSIQCLLIKLLNITSQGYIVEFASNNYLKTVIKDDVNNVFEDKVENNDTTKVNIHYLNDNNDNNREIVVSIEDLIIGNDEIKEDNTLKNCQIVDIMIKYIFKDGLNVDIILNEEQTSGCVLSIYALDSIKDITKLQNESSVGLALNRCKIQNTGFVGGYIYDFRKEYCSRKSMNTECIQECDAKIYCVAALRGLCIVEVLRLKIINKGVLCPFLQICGFDSVHKQIEFLLGSFSRKTLNELIIVFIRIKGELVEKISDLNDNEYEYFVESESEILELLSSNTSIPSIKTHELVKWAQPQDTDNELLISGTPKNKVLAVNIESWSSMLIPLLARGAFICASFSVMRPFAEHILKVNLFCPSMMMSVTIAMCIDYLLFLLSRYREEVERYGKGLHQNKQRMIEMSCEAVRQTIRWSGKVIDLSGCILSLKYFVLTFYPMEVSQSVDLSTGDCNKSCFGDLDYSEEETVVKRDEYEETISSRIISLHWKFIIIMILNAIMLFKELIKEDIFCGLILRLFISGLYIYFAHYCSVVSIGNQNIELLSSNTNWGQIQIDMDHVDANSHHYFGGSQYIVNMEHIPDSDESMHLFDRRLLGLTHCQLNKMSHRDLQSINLVNKQMQYRGDVIKVQQNYSFDDSSNIIYDVGIASAEYTGRYFKDLKERINEAKRQQQKSQDGYSCYDYGYEYDSNYNNRLLEYELKRVDFNCDTRLIGDGILNQFCKETMILQEFVDCECIIELIECIWRLHLRDALKYSRKGGKGRNYLYGECQLRFRGYMIHSCRIPSRLTLTRLVIVSLCCILHLTHVLLLRNDRFNEVNDIFMLQFIKRCDNVVVDVGQQYVQNQKVEQIHQSNNVREIFIIKNIFNKEEKRVNKGRIIRWNRPLRQKDTGRMLEGEIQRLINIKDGMVDEVASASDIERINASDKANLGGIKERMIDDVGGSSVLNINDKSSSKEDKCDGKLALNPIALIKVDKSSLNGGNCDGKLASKDATVVLDKNICEDFQINDAKHAVSLRKGERE